MFGLIAHVSKDKTIQDSMSELSSISQDIDLMNNNTYDKLVQFREKYNQIQETKTRERIIKEVDMKIRDNINKYISLVSSHDIMKSNIDNKDALNMNIKIYENMSKYCEFMKEITDMKIYHDIITKINKYCFNILENKDILSSDKMKYIDMIICNEKSRNDAKCLMITMTHDKEFSIYNDLYHESYMNVFIKIAQKFNIDNDYIIESLLKVIAARYDLMNVNILCYYDTYISVKRFWDRVLIKSTNKYYDQVCHIRDMIHINDNVKPKKLKLTQENFVLDILIKTYYKDVCTTDDLIDLVRK